MSNTAKFAGKFVLKLLLVLFIVTTITTASSSKSISEVSQPGTRIRAGDIAIAADGKSYQSKVSNVFGKCEHFIIGNPSTGDFKAVKNTHADDPAGAGVSAAEMIAKRGVKTVITGSIGPNAHQTLSSEGIRVLNGKGETVQSAIEKYNAGELDPLPAGRPRRGARP
jgi:predicted Fe-Mo cluster-binding NifX family protein